MSVKIKAKNANNVLQTLTCNTDGKLNVGLDKTITHLTLLNQTIGANSFTTAINLTPYPSEGGHLWGNSDTHYNLILQYSNDNITFLNIKWLSVVNIDGDFTFNSHLEIPPKFIRFHNPKSSSVSCSFNIDLIT